MLPRTNHESCHPMLKLEKAVQCEWNSVNNTHSLKRQKNNTSVWYMLTYSSKKSNNSCVFYSFCCSVPTEIIHSHQVGIQSSCPLAKCWHLIHEHPSPQGTSRIWLPIWALLSGPCSQVQSHPCRCQLSFLSQGFAHAAQYKPIPHFV